MRDRRLVAAGIVAGAIAVVLGVLALAGVFGDAGESTQPNVTTGAVSPGRPRTTAVEPQPRIAPPVKVARIKVGGRPEAIAAGAGAVWTADTFSRRAARIDPGSRRPQSLRLPGFPGDVAAGGGAAWFALPEQGALARATPDGRTTLVKVGLLPVAVAFGEGAVWVLADRQVQKVDPASGKPAGPPIRLPVNAGSIAAGEGGVWVVGGNKAVYRVNPDSGTVGRPIPVPNAFNVAAGAGAVWVATANATVVRIDPGSQRAAAPVKLPGALDVATGEGAVWVTSSLASVSRLDPASGHPIGRPLRVGEEPDSVSVGAGAAWVASAGNGSVTRIEPVSPSPAGTRSP